MRRWIPCVAPALVLGIALAAALSLACRSHAPAPADFSARAERARVLFERGDWQGARELRERQVADLLPLLPTDHPDLQAAYIDLAESLHALGDLQGAQDLAERAVGILQATVPPGDPRLVRARAVQARVFATLGWPATAQAAPAILDRPCEEPGASVSPALAQARALLERARKNLSSKEPAAAREDAAQGIELLLASAAEQPAAAELLAALGALSAEVGDLPSAERARRRVVEIRERSLPTDHVDTLAARLDLARTLYLASDNRSARNLQEAVVEALERSQPESLLLIRARRDLANTMRRSGALREARAELESLLEDWDGRLPEDHPELLACRLVLATSLAQLGEFQRSRELMQRVIAGYERTLPEDHPSLLQARQNLALAMREDGDLEEAKELLLRVIASQERSLPPDHPELLRARGNLASVLSDLGDLPGARALKQSVLESYERSLPEDHPELLDARESLALALHNLGDFEGSRALKERVLAAYERILPADHPDLSTARQNLAVTLLALRDLEGARALLEQAVSGLERKLPADHPYLLAARVNLASATQELGDAATAGEIFERVLATRERTLPADHPDIQSVRLSLATARHELGDLAGARELYENVLSAYERILPADHPHRLVALQDLAVVMQDMGELAGARALQERVLECLRQAHPDTHPEVVRARFNLAGTLYEMGDFLAARSLFEQVLAARGETMPDDHPDLLAAKANLAVLLKKTGDLESGRALEASVLEAMERTLPEDHPHLLSARSNLATTLYASGDLRGARTQFEQVFDARAKTLAPEHPDLLAAEENLANTLAKLGEFARAQTLAERVLAARERSLPRDHPDLGASRGSLAATRLALGDVAGVRALVPAMIEGLELRTHSASLLASREACESLALDSALLSQVLAFVDPADAALRARLFALIETRRLVPSVELSVARNDAGLAPLVRAADEARSRLHDRVANTGAPGAASGTEVAELVEARDRAEGALVRGLAERGVFTRPVDTTELARALPEGAAAVGLLRYAGVRPREEGHDLEFGEEHLLAYVLTRRGSLTRIDLGPADALERKVQAWRGALGGSAGRGVGLGYENDPRAGASEEALGSELRERLVDPLLAAAGEGTRTLFVCPDDFVHLVPLDALVSGTGRVGDRVRIVGETSFARLLAPRVGPTGDAVLLVLGAPDYGVAPEEGPTRSPANPSAQSRSLPVFQPLVGAEEEARSVAALFERGLERPARLLIGSEASKDGLVHGVPGAHFVHLATHGWFAPESVKSTLDEDARAASGLRSISFESAVTGLAPLTLCGLALAGANQGRDAVGRVPGILTAEELASFDLRNCELAVLSACETNVGLRRAGQGIQSLQTALHAAGARTAITSLWKVDDAATRRLFELFYSKLWKDKLGKADALWQAKMALRAEGHPPRDWAGWVLSGDPD